MYFKKLTIKNFGPIKSFDFNFSFLGNGNPKPLVLVGLNGSGKSIVLAHLINALITIKQQSFEDVEINNGKVYKYRSPLYISIGEAFSFSKVEFQNDLFVSDWTLNCKKKDFVSNAGIVPNLDFWGDIPEHENSYFSTNASQKSDKVNEIFSDSVAIYFPVNRYEEPAWLNQDDLKIQAHFSELRRVSGISNREIIQTNPLKKNQDWVLDVVLDKYVNEAKFMDMPLPQGVSGPTPTVQLTHYVGQNTLMLEGINEILGKILMESGAHLRIGVANRKNRQISVMAGNEVLVQNIFQLSTGESILLNLFLSILRDFDLSTQQDTPLAEICGIVIIDEVDAHLHIVQQTQFLPKLIKLFPKIQFILTTHSPFFILGLNKQLGSEGFDIIELPDARLIKPSEFSEFESLFDSVEDAQNLQLIVNKSTKPIVFVEGTIDIDYINKAAALLGKQNILDAIELRDAGGFGGLNKIHGVAKTPIVHAFAVRFMLLYDCDVSKNDQTQDGYYLKVIPQYANPIEKGIENLFSKDVIELLRQENPRFIDITPAHNKVIRGVNSVIPEKLEINSDEKRNICNWLVSKANKSHFEGFSIIFDFIESFINGK